MTDKPNALQDVVEDLMTDPDRDADDKPAPVPPQTIGNEPDDEASAR